MTARRASLTAVAGVVAVAVLLAFLVVWSASIGTSGVLTGHGLPRVTRTESSPPTTGPVGKPRKSDIERELEAEHHGPWWVRFLGAALLIGLGLAALWLLDRAVRRAVAAWRDRLRPPERAPHLDFDVLGTDEALAEEMGADAGAQREVLLTGEPRNAVVAAWSRFEEQAERAGIARSRWETSTEFVLRLLESLHADDVAVSRLAALYHEARFSTHELGEPDRSDAIAALDRIHASLRPREVPR